MTMALKSMLKNATHHVDYNLSIITQMEQLDFWTAKEIFALVQAIQ